VGDVAAAGMAGAGGGTAKVVSAAATSRARSGRTTRSSFAASHILNMLEVVFSDVAAAELLATSGGGASGTEEPPTGSFSPTSSRFLILGLLGGGRDYRPQSMARTSVQELLARELELEPQLESPLEPQRQERPVETTAGGPRHRRAA
jgi:hypothetical protein